MKPIRILVLGALLIPALPAQAAEQEAWPAFGHALTLVQIFVRAAAESETPQQHRKAIEDVLLGRNATANEAAAGLMKDIATGPRAKAGPLQARKDLTAMGLTYHDSRQFLDAVKRNDTIAAELFIAGGGVDLAATDFRGRDAAELARANGNERLAELVARSRPAAR